MSSNRFVMKIEALESSGKNWSDWSFQVKLHIGVHDALTVVDGELEAPEKPDEGASDKLQKEYEAQRKVLDKRDLVARHIIVSNLSPSVRQLVKTCETAKSMWDKLVSVNEQRTEQRLDRLLTELFDYRMSPGDSVVTHIAKLEELWWELQDETWKEEQVKLPDFVLHNRILTILPVEYFGLQSACES